jgi:hypothetical protein
MVVVPLNFAVTVLFDRIVGLVLRLVLVLR